jgi:hypothetical protein
MKSAAYVTQNVHQLENAVFEMWHCVIWQKSTDVWKNPTASTSRRRVPSNTTLHSHHTTRTPNLHNYGQESAGLCNGNAALNTSDLFTLTQPKSV